MYITKLIRIVITGKDNENINICIKLLIYPVSIPVPIKLLLNAAIYKALMKSEPGAEASKLLIPFSLSHFINLL